MCELLRDTRRLTFGNGARLVVDCHGVTHDPRWYETHAHARMIVDYFERHGFTMVVPLLADPWDGAAQAEAVIDEVAPCYLGKPLLTAQCVGALTALALLARRPEAYLGAALYNPCSDPMMMAERYTARLTSPPIDFAAITAPVAIWHGTEDRTVVPEQTRRLACLLPNLAVHWVRGGRHGTDPHAYIDGLDGFIASIM